MRIRRITKKDPNKKCFACFSLPVSCLCIEEVIVVSVVDSRGSKVGVYSLEGQGSTSRRMGRDTEAKCTTDNTPPT